MIKAKHHIVVYPFFKWLTRFLIKRHFCAVHIAANFTRNNNSVLVVANHISWWDGFWLEYLNQKVIHGRLHFMMLEEQLRKHWYFQYAGGYSVRPKSREIPESIDYTIQLLSESGNFVIMFPQGKIHSSYHSPVHFASGIQRIVSRCAGETNVLFVANFTDYFSDVRPHVFMYAETFSAASLKGRSVEEAYNLFFNGARERHKSLTS